MRLISVLVLALAAAGCGTSEPNKVPLELKERLPVLSTLDFSLPGQRGQPGSASEAVFKAVDEATASLRALSVLDEYLSSGGVEEKGLSITIALEGAPHVADQIVRYSREASRLDLERPGDHAFFYLQYDQGFGFDPDSAIGESRMLVEGSTVRPAAPGTRASAATASGLSTVGIGTMRFHFNHRVEDTNDVQAAAQLDFDAGTGSKNLAYFPMPIARGEVTVALWQKTHDAGGGLIYASQRTAGGTDLAYRFIAQYTADGSLAVWSGDGKLWGCYDPSGAELGNGKNPGACASFKDKFLDPPANPALWPPLPTLQ